MGNTIEFPNKEDFYIQKANQCQKEEDLIGAIDWLEKGYIKTNSEQLLEKLWTLLYRTQDWNEIIWLVEEFELKEEKYLSVYLEALIHMNRFEQVEAFLKEYQQLESPWIASLQLKMMNQKLKNEQEKVQQLQEIGEALQAQNKIFSVEEKHYITQVLIDSTLAQKEYVIQLFLLHPQIPMFDKAILLDEWLESGTLEAIQLLWNGEMKQIKRNKLFSISKSRFYKEESVLLKELINHFPMEEATMLAQKWMQDTIRLYPFQEEYISSFEEWIKYFSKKEELLQSLFYDDATFIKQYDDFRENKY
ncbi:hypothetical protein [uncultured Granulicatella sp.]|uniref:hypothetical protein n=1 Tax=uncultured Granulicatella sp. TaxID=316089 RepID=UPI0028D87A58|nr:hypothetical protein [uncultured Granulicatella sp.]